MRSLKAIFVRSLCFSIVFIFSLNTISSQGVSFQLGPFAEIGKISTTNSLYDRSLLQFEARSSLSIRTGLELEVSFLGGFLFKAGAGTDYEFYTARITFPDNQKINLKSKVISPIFPLAIGYRHTFGPAKKIALQAEAGVLIKYQEYLIGVGDNPIEYLRDGYKVTYFPDLIEPEVWRRAGMYSLLAGYHFKRDNQSKRELSLYLGVTYLNYSPELHFGSQVAVVNEALPQQNQTISYFADKGADNIGVSLRFMVPL